MQTNSLKKRDSASVPEVTPYSDSDIFYGDDYYGARGSGQTEKQMLLRFLSTLRKYWLLIATMTLLVTGLVIVWEAQKPDFYQAAVRIQVNNEINPATGGNSPGSIILNPGNDPAYFTTQLQILEGSGMLRRVVKVLDLEHNSAFFKPLSGKELSVWQNVQRMFGFYRPAAAASSAPIEETADKKLDLKVDATVDLDDQAEKLAPYVRALQGGMGITPVKDSRTSQQTRIIEVEFTHLDPQMAAKVANSIGDVYVLQNLERKVESNATAGDFLQKRVAELQSQIRLDEERLINYAKSNQILTLDSAQDTVVQKLTDLHSKLSAAEGDRINAEATYRAAVQNPMRETIAENKDGRTSGLESQLTALRQRLVQLKIEFTDEWPEVKRVRGEIAAIENELQANKKRSSNTEIATLEQTYRQAASREKELRTLFENQRGTVLTQNEAAVNYRIIKQEIDTNKGLLQSLLQRFRETEVVLNGTPNNVHIVDRALVPRGPSGPQRMKNVMIAFFASLLAGLGLAFFLNWLDDTVRVDDDLERLLGTPVIGLMPNTSRGIKTRFLPSKANGNGAKRIGKNSYQLESFHRPVVAEAFNQLRTSLLLSTAGGAPQTVLITSAQPLEGKTITSLNLARSLAQLGNRVLLIDADLRSPKMHLLNNLNNQYGLSTLLTVKELNDDIINDTIHKDIDPNLDLLTSGPNVPNPSNLFSSAEMRALLDSLSTFYKHIVIDSPPVMYFSDSVILSTCADAVMLIARANVSSRDVLARAKKTLQDVRVNVIGIVLNGVPLGDFKYYYDGYYQQLEAPVEETNGNVLHLD